jgi:UDP-3-O-[3-hydroxymyristoyl] glucosamine N-acyltransferase
MTVRFTSPRQPLFPWPEDAHALADELMGPAGSWCPEAPSGRTVVAAPWVLWNAQLIRAFDAAAQKLPARLVLTCTPMTEFTAALGGAAPIPDGTARAYDLFLTEKGAPELRLEELRAQAYEVQVLFQVDIQPIRTDGNGPAPHTIELPRSGPLVAHVTSWPHLLWLMQMAPFSHRAEVLGDATAASRKNVVGNNVRVHKTAVVEGSVLLDGVEVEAHATVMDSVLGEGVRVADHTAIHHSVIGGGCSTLGDGFLRRVVALKGSTISNMDLREVVLGRGVFITAGVIFFTGSRGHNAPCGQSPETLQDSGHAELGGAVGHGCVLGTRAIFEPGRALPGGTVIVMRPEEGVLHMPVGLPAGTLTAWDNAALVPVATRWPGYKPPETD